MEKRKLDVKMVLSYSDAVSYVEDLLKSFKSGRIVVQKGDEHIVLTPPDQVEIEVEAKIKKDRQAIAFELSWIQGGAEGLSISDKEPTAQPKPMADTPAAKPAAKPVDKPVSKPAAIKATASEAKADKPAAAASESKTTSGAGPGASKTDPSRPTK